MGKCCLNVKTTGPDRGASAGFLKIKVQVDKINQININTKN
jgi:hypothetical protein